MCDSYKELQILEIVLIN